MARGFAGSASPVSVWVLRAARVRLCIRERKKQRLEWESYWTVNRAPGEWERGGGLGRKIVDHWGAQESSVGLGSTCLQKRGCCSVPASHLGIWAKHATETGEFDQQILAHNTLCLEVQLHRFHISSSFFCSFIQQVYTEFLIPVCHWFYVVWSLSWRFWLLPRTEVQVEVPVEAKNAYPLAAPAWDGVISNTDIPSTSNLIHSLCVSLPSTPHKTHHVIVTLVLSFTWTELTVYSGFVICLKCSWIGWWILVSRPHIPALLSQRGLPLPPIQSTYCVCVHIFFLCFMTLLINKVYFVNKQQIYTLSSGAWNCPVT